jgi:transcription initiation factor TFIIIB Brf1 subunit/transcription initiation factor TFIIB
MEIKACEKCGSIDTSEDTSNGEHTCLKCGHVSKGVLVDFFGTRDKEKAINPNKRIDPFQIQTRIRSPNKIL